MFTSLVTLSTDYANNISSSNILNYSFEVLVLYWNMLIVCYFCFYPTIQRVILHKAFSFLFFSILFFSFLEPVNELN